MDKGRKEIGLLAGLQALFSSVAVTMVSVVALVGMALSPNPKWATLPYALVTVGTALSTIPLSFLMKRWSRRTGFILGAVSGVVGAVMATLALQLKSFELLLLAAPFFGIYQASSQYYRFAAAEAVGEKDRGIAISLVLTGSVFAAVIAPNVARWSNTSWGLDLYMGPYVMIGAIAVLALVVTPFLHKRSAVEDEQISHGDERPLSEILRQPSTITAMFLSLVGWTSMIFIISATPIAMHGHGFGYDDSTIVIQWHMLGMYVPSFFTGFLIRRFGVEGVLMGGVLLLALTLSVGYSGTDFASFATALVLLGVGWNFAYVGSTTLLTETYRPSERAKVQGMNEFITFTSSAIAGFSAGYVHAYLGWQGVMMINGGLVFAGSLVVLWHRSVRKKNQALLS